MVKRILQNMEQKVRFNVHKVGANDTDVDYNQSKKERNYEPQRSKKFF
jgi:hypothetical protein